LYLLGGIDSLTLGSDASEDANTSNEEEDHDDAGSDKDGILEG